MLPVATSSTNEVSNSHPARPLDRARISGEARGTFSDEIEVEVGHDSVVARAMLGDPVAPEHVLAAPRARRIRGSPAEETW